MERLILLYILNLIGLLAEHLNMPDEKRAMFELEMQKVSRFVEAKGQ